MDKKVLLVRVGSAVLERTEHPHQSYPPFLLKYAQALLASEKKYQTKLIDCYVNPIPLNILVNETNSWSPDLIVVFLSSLNSDVTLEYVSFVKKRNKDTFTVGVGPDATFNSQRYIGNDTPLDLILYGEAEKELVSLVENFDKNNSVGIQESIYHKYRNQPIVVQQLDSLPIPDYSLNELLSYRFLYPVRMNRNLIWGHLLGNRGCFHNCIFCSQNTKESFSRTVRVRSAVNVVDEIEYLLKVGANFISFADDDFTISRKYVYSICEEIQNRGLNFKWTAQARIDEVDAPLLKTMKDAGCALLAFGIESGSERVLKLLQKNDTNIDWARSSKEVFRECRKLGIATVALFIIGSPTETNGDIEKSIELAKELRADIIQVHFFTLYPGSKAYRQFNHKIKERDISRLYHYSEPLINLSNLKLEELQKMQIIFYRKVLLRPNFIFEHLIKYVIFYFHNQDVFWTLFKKVRKLLLKGAIKKS